MNFEDMSAERRGYEKEMRTLEWWEPRRAHSALCGVLAHPAQTFAPVIVEKFTGHLARTL